MKGLELLVQNLSRLDESNDEDAQGVNSSMGCIENLVEIRPNIAVLLCERTHILKFLLLRLKVREDMVWCDSRFMTQRMQCYCIVYVIFKMYLPYACTCLVYSILFCSILFCSLIYNSADESVPSNPI